jgi:tetratricopeptide (TPR) repeat protein
MYQSWYLSRCNSDIRRSGAAIEAAKSEAQRAAAYADRGTAYSEKARYSRAMKLVEREEYNRLFGLAIQDHNQAIALDPENAEMYYRRGHTYFDRAGLEMMQDRRSTAYLTLARADFSKAVEKNRKHAMAFDMLGLVDSSMGDWTQAIADFEQEAALAPRTLYRVSDAYCNRGSVYLRERKLDLAASDFNQAIEIRKPVDPCECEPYNPLLAIYLRQTQEYDKARKVVAKAQAAKAWIAPEYLKQLEALSDNQKTVDGK